MPDKIPIASHIDAVGEKEEAILFNEKGEALADMIFSGGGFNTIGAMKLVNYGRRTALALETFGVQSTNHEFDSRYSGYVGLAPYSRLEKEHREHSFLYQLKEAKKVDKLVVAFYVSQDPSKQSLIKFGSYDLAGMADRGKEMHTFKTISPESWNVHSSGMSINGKIIYTGVQARQLLVEPQMPFIFLGGDDFRKWKDIVEKAHPETKCSESGCYFDK